MRIFFSELDCSEADLFSVNTIDPGMIENDRVNFNWIMQIEEGLVNGLSWQVCSACY